MNGNPTPVHRGPSVIDHHPSDSILKWGQEESQNVIKAVREDGNE